MEPRTSVDQARWVALMLEGLAREVQSLRSQARALVATPPALRADERALAGLLLAQIELIDRQCVYLSRQLDRLRAGD